MTPTSQGGDRLQGIIDKARRQADETRIRREAQARHVPDAGAQALVDKSADVPDAMALARLYRDQSLVERLPETPDESPAGSRRVDTQETAGPSMSVAEVRNVMRELQKTSASFETYEPPRGEDPVGPPPVEPAPVRRGQEWAYVVGALAVIVAVIALIWLANGPLRYRP